MKDIAEESKSKIMTYMTYIENKPEDIDQLIIDRMENWQEVVNLLNEKIKEYDDAQPVKIPKTIIPTDNQSLAKKVTWVDDCK